MFPVVQKIRVKDRCLIEHAPSPQMCALAGDVWDDSQAGTERHAGGRCLSERAGLALLKQPDSNLEMVEIDVTHDGQSE
jgi:hypothetical protein